MTTTVPSSIINTDANELQNLLNLLPQTPIMIPLKPQDKRPDTPGSWKNPTCHLTPKQAIQHLQKGGNIGIVAHEWLCIIDLDNPKKYLFPKKTLTIKTRSGALHKYYINDGTIQNSVGVNSLAKCGEVRAEWQYVVSPGSYVPPPEGSTGEGLYRIVDYTPIVELSSKELPNDFLPNTTVKVIPQEHINPSITVRNKQGLSLQDIQTLDPELSRLLQNDDTKYLNDASKADMATMTLLYHTYQFDEPTILSIMKQYRSRPKLDRPDYLSNTLQKIRQTPPTKNKTMPVTRSPQQHTNNNSNGSTATSTTIIQKVNDKQIDLTQILANLKNQFTFKTPEDTSELYVYTKGIYSPAEKMIETILETELQNKLTNHYVNEIMGHLKRDSYVSRDNINHYNGVIPLENGLLNIVTGTLEEYTPDKMFTFKLPLNFNAEADCPQFKKWLSEVQTPENILVLQEYAGYTLLPDMPYHKALFMVGTGGNGKSTFLTTIENIIGHDNTANIDLQDINSDNRFIKANFYGKLANISNEPEIKRWFETPIFKQLTGGDRISAELKNVQKPLKFVNYAKFYFSGNNLPRVRDTSAGFKRRLIIVKWEKSFEGK
ncbi:MAG: phage/plasmid primase, P4 family, partial [Candidatus Bathyarchaeota archaeon]|nr:phage/plasmid primase, P4 family [Candidatus Termiticorpusculum sp.]MCL2868832.1 phage/plasmid primase, P4 family [Candidatus Termiticorpusculum sp.]